MIFLDYRKCGKTGEPKVVHVDQEFDYKITILAENFEEFIDKLCTEEEFEENEDDKENNNNKSVEYLEKSNSKDKNANVFTKIINKLFNK